MPRIVDSLYRGEVRAMSVQNALRFIQRCRQDEGLRARIQAVDPRTGLEGLVPLGTETGLPFSIDEMREAYRQEWIMRWLHQTRQAED
jgi:hypothetical protein